MNIEKRTSDGFTVLAIQGDVKVGAGAPTLDETLERVLEDDEGHAVLDLSQVRYMDSTGISHLVGYLKRLKNAGRKLILVNPSSRIRKLLEMVHLIDVIPIYDTVGQAVQAER